MKFYRIIPFIVISLWICSCSEKKKQNLIAEPKNYVALTDTLAFEEEECVLPFLMPIKLLAVNKYLVVANAKGDFVFNVYEIPLGKSYYQSVHFGRGPHELISPDYNSMISEGGLLLVADQDHYIKKFSLGDNVLKIESKERFLSNGDPLNGVIKIGDYFLNVNYGERQEHPFEFVLVDKEGHRKYIGPIPNWDKTISEGDPNSLFVYQSTHIVRPDHKEIAVFYNRYRRVRFLDIDGTILSETAINYPTKADKVPDSEGYYYTYGEACASKEYIVVNAINSFRHRMPENYKQKEYSEFQIWDWKGQLIKRIIVRCRITLYTVDFHSKVLYGIDSNKDRTIYRVDLSHYL